MTTNRMGLDQTLSDERLELFIRQPLDNGLTRGEQMELVREALARRKASKEPMKTQFKQVADLYEMQFDDGRTCAFHTDAAKAVQWLITCDGNKVQEYVKLERLQNALTDTKAVTVPDTPTDDERLMEMEGISVVKLPSEFHSEHGVVVQLEKVMAALAVHGIKYERRHQKVVGLRAGIDAIRAEGIDIDAEKISAEKCHK